MKHTFFWLLISLVAMAGCQSAGSATQPSSASRPAAQRTEVVSPPSAPSGTSRAAAGNSDGSAALAYLNDQPIAWQEMQKPLLETAGGLVLGELVLEREVIRRLRNQGSQITSDMVERERRLLAQSMSTDPNEAARLLRRLRHSRGEDRFERRLRINAGLRALVQDQVSISDAAVRKAYQQVYGPAYEARLIVVPTMPEANRLLGRLRAGASFIDTAVAVSTDVSAPRGGMLPPINAADDSYPLAVRTALGNMQPGQISEPVVVENGFAILRLDRKIPASNVSLSQVRSQMEARVRRQVEQVLATQQARTILQDVQLTIMNPALQDSWNRRKDELLQE